MPNFPEDPYGLTFQDRLKWAPLALYYVKSQEDISFLGGQQFEDGLPLYNERELRHMVDVQKLTRIVLYVGVIGWLVMVGLGIWAWRGTWWDNYKMMLTNGGVLTVVLIVLLIFIVMINFVSLFTYFHRIFFEGDTWLFHPSDTLIRLFPLIFWRDIFIFAGVFTLVGGLVLWYIFGRRRHKSVPG
jgi:integral membrane protein (TIGR01906 family)